MRRLVSRYTHVPLAVASVVVLAVVIAWLLMDRLGGPWPRWRAPAPSVVAIPAVPDAAGGATPAERAPAGPPERAASSAPVAPRPPAPTPEQYALESGPFAPGEAADRLEGEVNRLGHTTVRFRKEDTTRLFVVTATGFASSDEARQAARELDRGTVVEEAGVAEIVLGRHRSLAGAVAAARPLRARGFEVRVHEALAPSGQYHIRYGQFARRADAQAYREALARRGIRSRVVKVR
ncbi:MAG TPA: SPOR domain-containing protein [Candidatus Thermoplasmatota archaeon]